MERKSKSQNRVERVDKWVKSRYPSLTGRQIEEAIDRGLVTNPRGKPYRKGERVSEESAVDTSALEKHLGSLKSFRFAAEIPIVTEGDGFLVVDKPAGIHSHPLSLFDTDTLTQWALARFPEAQSEFPEVQPTLVPHRLDQGTSGLQVVALSRNAYEFWRGLFARKEVEKKYLAWCWGEPRDGEFEIPTSIAHDAKDPRKMAIPSRGEAFKPPVMEAQTFCRLLRKGTSSEPLCLIEVRCFTGVTHQVRVHLASIGLPLVGDRLYDSGFGQRPHQPESHLLRAVSLHLKDGKEFSVDGAGFSLLF